MTLVRQGLPLSFASILLFVLLAGCASNEPQGFMSGDTEGLGHGIPAPEPSPAAPQPPTDSSANQKGAAPDKGAPSPGEAKNSLGYTPDAEGAQSNQPESK